MNGSVIIDGKTYTIDDSGVELTIPTPTPTTTQEFIISEVNGISASEKDATNPFNLSNLPVKWNASSFMGFYYDMEDSLGQEELNINNINISERNIPVNGLYYNTTPQVKMLSVVKNGFGSNVTAAKLKGLEKTNTNEAFDNGSYQVIGWQGEKYVALNSKVHKLTKPIIEGATTADRKTLVMGDTWHIGEGWAITARSIDAKAYPRQVWLVLSKDGVKKDERFVSQGYIYNYLENNISNETNVPVFITYVDSVFAGATTDMVQLRYTWLISSNVTTINNGDQFGLLQVDSISPNIVLTNKISSVNLPRSNYSNITEKLRFKVADNDTLRFVPVTLQKHQVTY